MLTLMFWLIVAHFIGDIALQSSWVANLKGDRWYIMLCHCVIWTGVCCIPLSIFGTFIWWKPVALFVGHFLCDSWKARKPKDDAHWHLIYWDQAFHGLQLLLVALL